MSDLQPRRGHIYRMSLGRGVTLIGIVVSGDLIHRTGNECHTALVVADRTKVFLPTWVRLTSADPGFGYVVGRDVGMVAHDELKEDLGAVSAGTMAEVDRVLKLVYQLP